MDGADYLAQANAGVAPALGRRVVVIGGGSAAIDVARTARRAGHDVTILALESASQLPAQREEIDEALEEGIALVDGAMLTAAAEDDRGGLVLTCVRVRFERGAERGQFTVTPIAASEFSLAADALIPSIGQDPDLAPVHGALEADGALVEGGPAPGHEPRARVRRRRRRQHGALRHRGDRHGQARGARNRSCALRQARRKPAPMCRAAEPEPIVDLAAINTHYHPRAGADDGARDWTIARRFETADEVQLGLDIEEALAETGALLLVRHVHPVRQLRRLLPGPRGQARRRRLCRAGRLLQGLRPVRRRNAPPGR